MSTARTPSGLPYHIISPHLKVPASLALKLQLWGREIFYM